MEEDGQYWWSNIVEHACMRGRAERGVYILMGILESVYMWTGWAPRLGSGYDLMSNVPCFSCKCA
jgi:hypothetical protein